MTENPADWPRLDEKPVASAQMIEWYAPETAAVLRETERERIALAIEAFFPDPHDEGEACEDCIFMHEAAKIARAGGFTDAGEDNS